MLQPETEKIMRVLGGYEVPARSLFVGGCVRDWLMSRPAGDIDIATQYTPEEVRAKLEQAGIKCVPTGIEHGTVTAVENKKSFEITTLRRDVKTDGRRAVVAFTENWAEDAGRRDFTLNTLLAAPDGSIYDPLGVGLEDMQAKRIRFVGVPATRIAEDLLRILRFFRFHAQLEAGDADPEALAACREAAAGIADLSRERITQEVVKILSVDNPVNILNLMFDNNVLAAFSDTEYRPEILGRLCILQSTYTPQAQENLSSRLLVLAGFAYESIARWESFLILPGAVKKQMEKLDTALSVYDLSEKSLKILIYRYGKDIALQALLLHHSKTKKQEDEILHPLITLTRNWTAPLFPVTGEDLIAAGIPEGPELGRRLKGLESRWIAEDFRPDKAALLLDMP